MSGLKSCSRLSKGNSERGHRRGNGRRPGGALSRQCPVVVIRAPISLQKLVHTFISTLMHATPTYAQPLHAHLPTGALSLSCLTLRGLVLPTDLSRLPITECSSSYVPSSVMAAPRGFEDVTRRDLTGIATLGYVAVSTSTSVVCVARNVCLKWQACVSPLPPPLTAHHHPVLGFHPSFQG
jgi:hypothetical protein